MGKSVDDLHRSSVTSQRKDGVVCVRSVTGKHTAMSCPLRAYRIAHNAKRIERAKRSALEPSAAARDWIDDQENAV
jgi:hypothetical protein